MGFITPAFFRLRRKPKEKKMNNNTAFVMFNIPSEMLPEITAGDHFVIATIEESGDDVVVTFHKSKKHMVYTPQKFLEAIPGGHKWNKNLRLDQVALQPVWFIQKLAGIAELMK